jgi:hypothetical protein
MATYTLKIPASPQFSAQGVMHESMMKARLDDIITPRWGKMLTYTADSTKVPKQILIAIMSAISGGYNETIPAGSVNEGLMGWSRLYGAPDAKNIRANAKTILNYEIQNSRMTSNEQKKLKELGYVYDVAKKSFPDITSLLQKKPEFNILVAGIFIGQCMDSKVSGISKGNWALDGSANLHLERVILVYLYGADTSSPIVQTAISGTARDAFSLMAAIKDMPQSAYGISMINKILGNNGYLDLLVNRRIVI